MAGDNPWPAHKWCMASWVVFAHLLSQGLSRKCIGGERGRGRRSRVQNSLGQQKRQLRAVTRTLSPTHTHTQSHIHTHFEREVWNSKQITSSPHTLHKCTLPPLTITHTHTQTCIHFSWRERACNDNVRISKWWVFRGPISSCQESRNTYIIYVCNWAHETRIKTYPLP